MVSNKKVKLSYPKVTHCWCVTFTSAADVVCDSAYEIRSKGLTYKRGNVVWWAHGRYG